MTITVSMCSCGKAPAYQDGLCVGCYSIRSIIGTPKQACSNCGTSPTHAKGRCLACYDHFRRHQKERSVVVRGKQYFCVNCGDPTLVGLGRCNACYIYFRRNGTERPASLAKMHLSRRISRRTTGICITCGKPTKRMECDTCRSYRHKHGVQRPAYLYSRKAKESAL